MPTPEELEQALIRHFAPVAFSKVIGEATSCAGDKFMIVIASEQFNGKSVLEKHRAVHVCTLTVSGRSTHLCLRDSSLNSTVSMLSQ